MRQIKRTGHYVLGVAGRDVHDCLSYLLVSAGQDLSIATDGAASLKSDATGYPELLLPKYPPILHLEVSRQRRSEAAVR